VASVVLNMDALFEAYVRRSLERSAELENWAVQVLDGNKPFGRRYLFSDNTAHIAQPDVVLRVADGTTPLANFEPESQDHPGARVCTATVPEGTWSASWAGRAVTP